MTQKTTAPFRAQVRSTKELGALVRALRKSKGLTLAKVSGITNLGMRFLSEFERGKETAEIGKVLLLLTLFGLEVSINTRGYYNNFPVLEDAES